MPWLELRITGPREAVPAVELALESAGALSITFEDSADEPIFEPALGETPMWSSTRVTGLFEADMDTRRVDADLVLPAGCQSRWHVLEDKDWEREWMKSYQPIQCAPNLWICPSWLEPPDTDAVNLILDPGLAFGTGTHPTTFMCLQWLAQQDLQDASIVDYGCGSGILGIAALLLGADNALGVDIDPQALIATRENTRRNKLSRPFPVYLPEATPETQADVVVANILAGPLVELAPQIIKHLKPGGHLCLSGVLGVQADTVMAAYSKSIDFAPVQTREEWACLSGQRHDTAS